MEYSFRVKPEDYVEHHLYRSAHTDRDRQKRQRSRILVPIAYLGFGIYLYFRDGQIIGLLGFALVAVLWYLFYPRFSAWRYRKFYERHIQALWSDAKDRVTKVSFQENDILINDGHSESRVGLNDLEECVEVEGHYFLFLKTGQSLILPKRDMAGGVGVKEMIQSYGKELVDGRNWVWM